MNIEYAKIIGVTNTTYFYSVNTIKIYINKL